MMMIIIIIIKRNKNKEGRKNQKWGSYTLPLHRFW